MTGVRPFMSNMEHLQRELDWLRCLVNAVIEESRPPGQQSEMLKGLCITDQEIDALLALDPDRRSPLRDRAAELRAEIDARAALSAERGVSLALPQLSRIFGLTLLEERVVVVALGAELDLTFERFFAYLQDDLQRKRPTVDLVLRILCPRIADRMASMDTFAPRAPLFGLTILKATHEDGLVRPVSLDSLTASFLLRSGPKGWDRGFPVQPVRTERPLAAHRWAPELTSYLSSLLAIQIERRAPMDRLICHFWGRAGTGRKSLAAALCREAGVPLIGASLKDIVYHSVQPALGLRDLFRQAVLLQSAVYLEDAQLLCEEGRESVLLRSLTRTIEEFSWITFLSGEESWPLPGIFGPHTFVSIPLPLPDISSRREVWLELAKEDGGPQAVVDWDEISAKFQMSPGQMRMAWKSAREMLRDPVAALTTADLARACSRHSNQRLGTLARPIDLRRGWDDLTLTPNAHMQLRELCSHVRHRRRVHEDWGFGRGTRGGVCALLYGASGVGKTMAVEIVAQELSLDVYRVDLSTVVSKYIGETEKNLSRIFNEAATASAILFFDEADALFGKRSEVKDAHDRYANIEINYLLQRIEDFDGLVILASNLRKNIDDGFFRRMHFSIEFPMPEAEDRYKIWLQHFPPSAPVGEDVDLGFLASRFSLSGGHIRNIVLNAAFLAASNGGQIKMEHLIRATRREYDKTGRVCSEVEFAPYHHWLKETALQIEMQHG